MPRLNTSDTLKSLVTKLKDQRDDHTRQIAEIDRTFADMGIGGGAAPAAKRGRPFGLVNKTKASGGRRKCGTCSMTAEASILKYVGGHAGATTKQVNEHWESEGRKGKADNTLTRFVKEKKLKRSKVEGERGSTYRVA